MGFIQGPFSSEEANYFVNKAYPGKHAGTPNGNVTCPPKDRKLAKARRVLRDALNQPMASFTIEFWQAMQEFHNHRPLQRNGKSVTATGILRAHPAAWEKNVEWSNELTPRVPLPETLRTQRLRQARDLVTAPHPRKDGNFPYTNQARNCFFTFASYRDCLKRHEYQESEVAEDALNVPACAKLSHKTSFLCPKEWREKWESQIEEGTFANPAWINDHKAIPIDQQRVDELTRFTEPYVRQWGRARVDQRLREIGWLEASQGVDFKVEDQYYLD